MGGPVIITPTAIRDLEPIVRFITHDSPQRAKRFGYALIDAALAIGPYPEMGRIVPELGDPDVREMSMVRTESSTRSSMLPLPSMSCAFGMPPVERRRRLTSRPLATAARLS